MWWLFWVWPCWKSEERGQIDAPLTTLQRRRRLAGTHGVSLTVAETRDITTVVLRRSGLADYRWISGLGASPWPGIWAAAIPRSSERSSVSLVSTKSQPSAVILYLVSSPILAKPFSERYQRPKPSSSRVKPDRHSRSSIVRPGASGSTARLRYTRQSTARRRFCSPFRPPKYSR